MVLLGHLALLADLPLFIIFIQPASMKWHMIKQTDVLNNLLSVATSPEPVDPVCHFMFCQFDVALAPQIPHRWLFSIAKAAVTNVIRVSTVANMK
jgi:hypothetical protein